MNTQGAAENNAMVGSVNQSGTIPNEDNQRESSTQSAKVYYIKYLRDFLCTFIFMYLFIFV